ncbi:MAG TPA: acyltransferase [Azospirillum sp.]|nr:acyltransferase [Azospirillum sp.]
MRFTVLDGWRGLCALMVASHHLGATWSGFDSPLVTSSYLFVDFFFVLSGFVIMHAYGARLRDANDVGAFVIRRFGRVWPLHMALVLAFFAIEGAEIVARGYLDTKPRGGGVDDLPLLALGTNTALVHVFGMHDRPLLNFPSWSISAEFWTYVLFAAVCFFLPSRFPAVATAMAAAGAAVVAGASPDGMNATWDLGIFRCVYGFFLGAMVHRLFAATGDRIRRHGGLLNAAEILVTLAVVTFVATAGEGPASLLAPFVFAAAVYVFGFEAGVLSRAIRCAAVRSLGTLSYSIYMVHILVLTVIVNAAKVYAMAVPDGFVRVAPEYGRRVMLIGEPWAMDLVFVLYIAATVAVAAVTYRLIEVPGRRFFNGLASGAGSLRAGARLCAFPPQGLLGAEDRPTNGGKA